MNNYFKNALDHINAEDELIEKTKSYLTQKLGNEQNIPVESKKTIRDYIFFPFSRKLAATVSVAFMTFLLFAGLYYYHMPVAYICFDTNNSVEFGVNYWGKIVSTKSFDAKTQDILDEGSMKYKSLKDGTVEMITAALKNGLIPTDGSAVIAVTSETDDSSLASRLEKEAVLGINEVIKEFGVKASIYKYVAPLSYHEEAQTLNITPGKYNLIKKIQKLDPEVNVEEYQNKDIVTVIGQYNELDKTNQALDQDKTSSQIPATDKSGNNASDSPSSTRSDNSDSGYSESQTNQSNPSQMVPSQDNGSGNIIPQQSQSVPSQNQNSTQVTQEPQVSPSDPAGKEFVQQESGNSQVMGESTPDQNQKANENDRSSAQDKTANDQPKSSQEAGTNTSPQDRTSSNSDSTKQPNSTSSGTNNAQNPQKSMEGSSDNRTEQSNNNSYDRGQNSQFTQGTEKNNLQNGGGNQDAGGHR